MVFLAGNSSVQGHCQRMVSLLLPRLLAPWESLSLLPHPEPPLVGVSQVSRPGGSELEGTSQGDNLLTTEQVWPRDHPNILVAEELRQDPAGQTLEADGAGSGVGSAAGSGEGPSTGCIGSAGPWAGRGASEPGRAQNRLQGHGHRW